MEISVSNELLKAYLLNYCVSASADERKTQENRVKPLIKKLTNKADVYQGEAAYKTLLLYADYFDVSLDYIYGRTDQPQGKVYDFRPKFEEDEDLRDFIEMCFDPSTPMSVKLKEMLLQMMKGGLNNE